MKSIRYVIININDIIVIAMNKEPTEDRSEQSIKHSNRKKIFNRSPVLLWSVLIL